MNWPCTTGSAGVLLFELQFETGCHRVEDGVGVQQDLAGTQKVD